MQSVDDLLQEKGRRVHTIAPTEPIVHGARLMLEHGIGSLVVVQHGAPIGIMTRNDIVQLVAKRPDAITRTTVADIMSTELEATDSTHNLFALRDHMVKRGIRHMPVLEGDELVGLITLADVLFLELEEAHVMNRHLESYLYGV